MTKDTATKLANEFNETDTDNWNYSPTEIVGGYGIEVHDETGFFLGILGANGRVTQCPMFTFEVPAGVK